MYVLYIAWSNPGPYSGRPVSKAQISEAVYLRASSILYLFLYEGIVYLSRPHAWQDFGWRLSLSLKLKIYIHTMMQIEHFPIVHNWENVRNKQTWYTRIKPNFLSGTVLNQTQSVESIFPNAIYVIKKL